MVVTPTATPTTPTAPAFRLAVVLEGPNPPTWLVECAQALAAEPGWVVLPVPATAGARAPLLDPVDVTLDLVPSATPARARRHDDAGRRWRLADAQGRALSADWPLLEPLTRGQGIALTLLEQAHAGAPWAVRRTSHRPATPHYTVAVQRLIDAVCSLVRQALIDLRLGLTPTPLTPIAWEVPALPSRRRALLAGRWSAWLDRQRARWLSEFWFIGVIEAPIADWVRSGGRLPVRWITRPGHHGHWADPMGLPGDPRHFHCEYVDETTGVGHIEQVTIDGLPPEAGPPQLQFRRLPLGNGTHLSFPLVIEMDGQRLGLLESSARRDCVLYRVDDAGQWTAWVTMLSGRAIADPALFRWEGRYWLACTEVALGEHDSLSLFHAERLEGPWLPHANNPVKLDITGARMAGGFFQMPGPDGPQWIRPAQNCLGDYGVGLTLQRVLRCTPTEYVEDTLARIEPQPDWPGPHGLHTLSSWGARTLIDAKRHGLNPTVLWRKLQQRSTRAGRAAATPAEPPSATPMPPPARRVCVYIPHLRLGGGETSLLRLVEGFLRSGLQVDLVVHTLAGTDLVPPPGAHLIELGVDGTLRAWRALMTVLRERQPAWLLSGFPHTNVAAVAAVAWAGIDCRCIVSEHAPLSLQIAQQANWRYRVLPPLVRWAYRRADAVVAVSNGVRDDLVQLAGPDLKLHVISNPVLEDAAGDDPSRRPTPRHPWLTDPALQVVLSVSRLSEEKDIPTLLRAFARLHAERPDTRLLLVGEGPERAALEALAATLQLSAVVQLPGRVQQPMHWMASAAVFALASRYEGFGNVLIEALACGTPVVCTDCPVGPREILADGRHGTLVPVGDAPAMAEALARALDARDPPPGATAHALTYTVGRASAAYRAVFDSLAPRA